jgi:hypothetical protein
MKGMKTGKILNLIIWLLLILYRRVIYVGKRVAGTRWPNKLWGAEDQSGASNWITPEKY